MKLSDLVIETGKVNRSKGWHEGPQPTFGDLMALIISELSEALEDHRVGAPPRNIDYVKDDKVACTYVGAAASALELAGSAKLTAMTLVESGHKPCGIIIELADAVIRICDCADRYGWWLLHNGTIAELCGSATATTPSFGDWFCNIAAELIWSRDMTEPSPPDVDPDFVTTPEEHLTDALELICQFAHWLGITGAEFEQAIEIKMAYNRTRPHRHGGKVL